MVKLLKKLVLEKNLSIDEFITMAHGESKTI